MKTLNVLAVTLIFAASALADDEETREMKIMVAGTSSDDSTAIHWIGSSATGFDMQGMQVGESQSIVDEDGRSILITRESDGFRFDVDGRTFVVPEIGARGEYLSLANGSDVTADFDVEIVGDHHAVPAIAMPAFGSSGVTIISDEPLDATTQESIKAVLQSAGRDDTVTFIDRSATPDTTHIRAIGRRVEIAQ